MKQDYSFKDEMDMSLTYNYGNLGNINYPKNFDNIHACPLNSCGKICNRGQVLKHLEEHINDEQAKIIGDFGAKIEQYSRLSMDVLMIGTLVNYKERQGHAKD